MSSIGRFRLVAAVAGMGVLNAFGTTYYASPTPVDPSTDGYCETETTPGTIKDAVDRATEAEDVVILLGEKYILDSTVIASEAASFVASSKAITIRAKNCDAPTVTLFDSEQSGRRMFNLSGAAKVFGIAFTNFASSASGGAISIGAGVVSNCAFSSCKSTSATANNGGGGAVYFSANGTKVYNSTFAECSYAGNASGGGGGALRGVFKGGNYLISGCDFVDCSSTKAGAGVFLYTAGTASTISNCTFIGKNVGGWVSQSSYGDGSSKVLKMYDCVFLSNTVCSVSMASVGEFHNCGFTNCTAGCMTLSSGAGAQIYDCSVVSNTVSNYAVLKVSSNTILSNCVFVGNKSTGVSYAAGAVFSIIADGCRAIDCKFIGNTSAAGGGAVTSISCIGSDFIDNTVTGNGITRDAGAVCKMQNISGSNPFGNPIFVDRCKFVGNKGALGAAVLAYGPVSNSLFVANSSTGWKTGYGCVYSTADYPTHCVNCTFVSNTFSTVGNAPVGGYVSAVNGLFNGNKAGGSSCDLLDITGFSATNCLYEVAIGEIDGAGNIPESNPKLYIGVPDKIDYSPRRRSVAVDAGMDVGSTASDIDLADNPRVFGKCIDIGCYECQEPAPGLILLLK